jgi:hypothetical protein
MVVFETGLAMLLIVGAALLLIPPIWCAYQRYLAKFR